jgi:type IV pilus modification protein PilV
MRARKGFTLIEVVVAMVLLTMVVLGSQGLAARMVHTTAESNVRMQAMQLAHDRVDMVRLDPQYDSLVARYQGTESGIPMHPGFTRVTTLTRTQTATSTGTIDFYTITVRVTAPALSGAVTRTVAVAKP